MSLLEKIEHKETETKEEVKEVVEREVKKQREYDKLGLIGQ